MDEMSIFLKALDTENRDDRNSFLDQACGDDSALRQRVDALLERHEEASSFLEQPVAEFEATMLGESPVATGNGPISVLRRLEDCLEDVPRVALRSGISEGRDPVVKPSSPELPARDADSRYQLQGEIARGGMGAIIKGRDTDLGRDLAIKVLLDAHKKKPELVNRFVEEAQIGGQLQHPGIAPVYELGQFSDRRPFFSMKLIKGTTLAALLSDREDKQADRPRLLGIFEQVCQTMAYAHSRGVIHRDLKPANVMVGAFGEVQVMDWGLAKVLSEGGVADEKRAIDKRKDISIIQTIRSLGSDAPDSIGAGSGSGGSDTLMGSVLGTPAYMPPEQALGEIDRLDERSDVFGLGAILCEILTGDPPYTGTDGTAVFRQATRGKLDDCFERLSNCGADAELQSIVKACLQLEPVDRPRNAGALAERMTAYLESVEQRLHDTELARVEADTRATEERKRRKFIAALAASALLTLGVAGGGWMWVKQKDAALARAASQAKLEAQIRQSRLEQQIGGELSTARALGNLESADLPEKSSIDRALAAVGRAENLLDTGDVADDLSQQVAAARVDLESLQRDFKLVASLEDAWDQEREYHAAQKRWKSGASQRTGVGNRSELEGTSSDETPGLLGIEHPSKAYKQAFADWGLSLDALTVDDAAKKLQSLDESLQPTALVSLDRWRHLLSQPRTVEQWQEVEWHTLQPVELKSRGRDTLKVLDDESIVASGPTPWFGYDLTFETDVTEISALRLEAMLHDSLPNRGPGRNSSGGFAMGGLLVRCAQRATPDEKTDLPLTTAVADYSSPIWPMAVSHPKREWHIGGGAGKTACGCL